MLAGAFGGTVAPGPIVGPGVGDAWSTEAALAAGAVAPGAGVGRELAIGPRPLVGSGPPAGIVAPGWPRNVASSTAMPPANATTIRTRTAMRRPGLRARSAADGTTGGTGTRRGGGSGAWALSRRRQRS